MINEFTGKYRFLSNFWSCYVEYAGVYYPSVENAYQAAKMNTVRDRERFRDIKASEAKRLGRVLPMRADWDKEKLDIMYELVRKKFKTSHVLRALLEDTGSEVLEEGNWWGDTFWGTVNGKGENHLGKILMKVRTEVLE